MSKDDKLQLTLKCMQSQQTVEPIFDIAGCNALYVPEQTFTYCKLLQKTCLNMSNNCLTSLDGGGAISDLVTLKVMDISENKFSTIPSEVGFLSNLVKLDISKNDIKSLPSSFGKLTNLQEINLSHNKFSKVPTCLCALAKLCKLYFEGNKIKGLPSDLCHLQSSLHTLSLDTADLHEPWKSAFLEGYVEGLMKRLCQEFNVDYTGINEVKTPEAEPKVTPNESTFHEDDGLTLVMENYMKKKRELMEKHIIMEKELEDRNTNELDLVLKKNIDIKKELSNQASNFHENNDEYENKKREQLLLHVELEKQIRQSHDEEMGAYLANTTNKENMLEDMTAQQNQIDRDIEGIVIVKDSDRQRLIGDLQSGEKNTEAVMEEIINASATKNLAFVALLEEQDNQIAQLVSTAAGSAAEVRKSEVLAAMHNMLAEAMMLESKVHDRNTQLGWISSLVEESSHSNLHVQDLLSMRQANDSAWCEMLLHDEECQAAAFKLLLLNNDLKRSNILRQASQFLCEKGGHFRVVYWTIRRYDIAMNS